MATTHALAPTHASPHILQPSTSSTTNKPLAPTPNPAPLPNHLGPTKQWNIPPRPKPGRKPAIDAPPTKRKAQNREAQRAFRERRAAKVGELEDQMKQMEEEDAREQEALRNHVKGLEAEVEKWQRISEDWRRQCEKVQGMVDRERQSMQQLELELQMSRDSMAGSTDAVPLKPRRPQHDTVAPEQQGRVREKGEGIEDTTCGRCSNGSRCQCIEEAFKMNDIAISAVVNTGFKRPLSPQNSADGNKRVRPADESNDEPTEIDFTTRKPPGLPIGSSSSSMPTAIATVDSCGFCQDGTTCICAEINRQNEDERRSQLIAQNVPSTRENQLSNSCTSNPGTCTQCQSNPASKNFCTSLAASCASKLKIDGSRAITSSTTGPTLNCADAFNRLAQHPNFPQASRQLNAWVPQLATSAMPSISTSTAHLGGRTTFEIEAASVMNVLKSFDVRFGEHRPKSEHDQRI